MILLSGVANLGTLGNGFYNPDNNSFTFPNGTTTFLGGAGVGPNGTFEDEPIEFENLNGAQPLQAGQSNGGEVSDDEDLDLDAEIQDAMAELLKPTKPGAASVPDKLSEKEQGIKPQHHASALVANQNSAPNVGNQNTPIPNFYPSPYPNFVNPNLVNPNFPPLTTFVGAGLSPSTVPFSYFYIPAPVSSLTANRPIITGYQNIGGNKPSSDQPLVTPTTINAQNNNKNATVIHFNPEKPFTLPYFNSFMPQQNYPNQPIRYGPNSFSPQFNPTTSRFYTLFYPIMNPNPPLNSIQLNSVPMVSIKENKSSQLSTNSTKPDNNLNVTKNIIIKLSDF